MGSSTDLSVRFRGGEQIPMYAMFDSRPENNIHLMDPWLDEINDPAFTLQVSRPSRCLRVLVRTSRLTQPISFALRHSVHEGHLHRSL